MNVLLISVLISSLSFFAYAYFYYTAPNMKSEFNRFGIGKLGSSIVLLEIAGGIGLLLGLKFNILLIIASLGLTLLMFAGIIVRISIKDSIWLSMPALFFMALNSYIFYKSLNLI